jgi:hypothetical protein
MGGESSVLKTERNNNIKWVYICIIYKIQNTYSQKHNQLIYNIGIQKQLHVSASKSGHHQVVLGLKKTNGSGGVWWGGETRSRLYHKSLFLMVLKSKLRYSYL